MNKKIKKQNFETINYFRSRKLGGNFLLTNDVGEFEFLTAMQFRKFLAGKLGQKTSVYKSLSEKGFIKGARSLPDLIKKYHKKNVGITIGPVLHIIVATLRCNFKCVYCHASAAAESKKGLDMDKRTAKKTVDMIFRSPARNLDIEFQGGEPLLNWGIVKYIVEYVREKERSEKRNINLKLVSNFSLMDDEKLKFFFDNNVGLCTSLDGPEHIQNKNRTCLASGGYHTTIEWFKKALLIYCKKPQFSKPGALATVTRYSLPYGKQIVGEYVRLGLPTIYLRPLNPFGFAKRTWSKIGYSAEEFISFYKKTLDHIIKLNQKGTNIRELFAVTFLTKMLTGQDPNHMDYRSPCGAAIGQLAYNYDGNVYTCDEGRMFAVENDHTFLLGNVHRNTFRELVNNETVHAMCDASFLENIPGCHDCAYNPYCGVCPIFNYSQQGSIVGQMPSNDRCRVNKAVFDHLFVLLRNKDTRSVLERWLWEK